MKKYLSFEFMNFNQILHFIFQEMRMKLPSKTSKIKPNENSIKNETSPVITGNSVNQRNQTSE